ncbi:rho GTPase-activating protein 28 isoform X1 [Arapaima gigas]
MGVIDGRWPEAVNAQHSYRGFLAKVLHSLKSSEPRKGCSELLWRYCKRGTLPARMAYPQGPCGPQLEQSCAHLDPQESPGCSYLEDYFKERKNIEEDVHGFCKEPVERRSLDEAELEEAWLREAGFSTLVPGGAKDERSAEALLSTLTRSQAALVKKRMNNYTQTLCLRNKQPVRHVRDIFPDKGSQPEQRKEKGATPVSFQLSPKLPFWLPVQNAHPPTSPLRKETLSFEVPYSDGAAAHKREKHCQDCQSLQSDSAELLSFQLPRPKLGLTGVEDLSPDDMKKVGYFAVIELSTLYDGLGIELKRNRTLHFRAGRETGLFGVPLTTVLENDRKISPASRVPLLFRKLLSRLEQTGLQAEGILRVSGSVSRVKYLRQELESKFYMGKFDWEQVRHTEAADLLKMFIRELPQPLLTTEHLPSFSAVLNISSPKHQIQALHLLIMLLPGPHRDTLKALLEFLSKVVAHEGKNRMSLWNVSMIVAPNLFTFHGKVAKQADVQEATGEAYLVRLLIIHQHLLWTVPCFLIAQLRRLNEASLSGRPTGSEKSRRKLLRKWRTERAKEDRNDLTDIREGVIRVQTPLHTKAIQLKSETRARDVIYLLNSENRAARSTSHRQRLCLFEVGGTIGERCLDPDTHLLDLYHVNPTCKWIIKPRTM